MKSLALVLVIGLLLPFFVSSGNPDETELNKEFTELCGHDYIKKVLEICRHSVVRSLHPQQFDLSQGSGDNDDSEETNIQAGQQSESNSGKQLLNEKQGALRQMTDDSIAIISQAQDGRERKTLIDFPTANNHTKLTASPLSTKCCMKSCTIKDIRRHC